MDFYFSPLACSMATRISLYEAGATANFVEVDTATQLTSKGTDFRKVNPLGLVPALALDDGQILTENAAILQYVASLYPEAKLAPEGGFERVRLQQWLCFIGTELHQGLFGPLLSKKANEGARAYALEKAAARLGLLEAHLAGRDFLLERFSVADAYLVTVLGWSPVTPVELAKWPAVAAYVERMRLRPSVATAYAEELAMYLQTQARRKSA
jgi:glutathione S-transferase